MSHRDVLSEAINAIVQERMKAAELKELVAFGEKVECLARAGLADGGTKLEKRMRHILKMTERTLIAARRP